MAASPWTWFCRRSLPVERAFCLPTVTKCLLTVYHLIIEVFSLILSGLYKQWKESRGHSCYQACCHCSSSRLSAWWGWARAPQSSAAPININNTNNKWTGGRSHVITYWQVRKEKLKFLSEHSFFSGSETDEEEEDGAGLTAEYVCTLAAQPGLGPPSCLGVDETLSVGSGQTWLLQTSLSVQQHKICTAGKILCLLYGELLTAQSGTDGKWRRFGFKVNVAANSFPRMQRLLWRQTASLSSLCHTQGLQVISSFFANDLTQREPPTSTNHCQPVGDYSRFPSNQQLYHIQHRGQLWVMCVWCHMRNLKTQNMMARVQSFKRFSLTNIKAR